MMDKEKLQLYDDYKNVIFLGANATFVCVDFVNTYILF